MKTIRQTVWDSVHISVSFFIYNSVLDRVYNKRSVRTIVSNSAGESVFNSIIRHGLCIPVRDCVGSVYNSITRKSREFINENN